MEFSHRVLETIWQHKGRIIGVVTAMLLSWIYLTHGFWRALVVFLILVTGYIVGARVDAGISPLPDGFLRYLGKRQR